MFAVWTECAAQAGEQGRARGMSISFPGCLPSGSTPCDVLLFPSCFLPLVTSAFSYPLDISSPQGSIETNFLERVLCPQSTWCPALHGLHARPSGLPEMPGPPQPPPSAPPLCPWGLQQLGRAGQDWKTWFLKINPTLPFYR